MAILPVNTGSAGLLSGGLTTTLDVPIPATGAGNDLVVGVDTGDNPAAPATVASVTVPFESLLLETGDHLLLETGSKLLLESSSNVASAVTFTSQVTLTNATARAELWSARAIEAGITRLLVTLNSAGIPFAASEEYSGVQALGTTATANGTGDDPSISLVTQDANNFVVASMGREGHSIGPFSGALVGTERARGQGFGAGFQVIAGVLLDNTSAVAGSVTCQEAHTALGPKDWAAVALELRSTTGAAGVTYPQLERFGLRGVERGVLVGVR